MKLITSLPQHDTTLYCCTTYRFSLKPWSCFRCAFHLSCLTHDEPSSSRSRRIMLKFQGGPCRSMYDMLSRVAVFSWFMQCNCTTVVSDLMG